MLGLASLSGALLYNKYGDSMKKAYKKTMKKAKKVSSNALEDLENM